MDEPGPQDHQRIQNSVPRDAEGWPQRHPDPADGSWTRDINGHDSDGPGRNNNCVDVALATADTYAGHPTAAAARTADPDADGRPSDRGESGGRDRIENTLGARFSDLGDGPDAFRRLEDTLRQSGHGSQAVIITQDSDGRAHAWNAVNHDGKITYIDAQTGQRSDTPLHNGDKGVFAIPLDPDRRPVDHGRPDAATDGRADREAPTDSADGERRPNADPAGSPDSEHRDHGETVEAVHEAPPDPVVDHGPDGSENWGTHNGEPVNYTVRPDEKAAVDYQRIRAASDDVAKIAENYGIDPAVVERAKNNLFMQKHDAQTGPGRENFKEGVYFAAYDEISERWIKATEGRLKPDDIGVLRGLIVHEYVESCLMEAGMPYASDHPLAWVDENRDWRNGHIGAHDVAPISFRGAPITVRGTLAIWPRIGLVPPDVPIAEDLSNLDLLVEAAKNGLDLS